LILLNNIIGGPGLNSRLNIALRERRGLVYTVESQMVCYSDTGLWSVYFGCDPADASLCCRLVRRVFNGLMVRGLSEAQLRRAKQQLRGQLAIASDNREQFALDAAKTFLHEGRERNLDAILSHIDAVTADELYQTANLLFDPNRILTLIYQ
jgi:predicted Zn-dependent peptidase